MVRAEAPPKLTLQIADSGILGNVKTNPFPWFPWWPKVEESHYLGIIAIAAVLALVLIYLSGV